jgi:hypothetical protein
MTEKQFRHGRSSSIAHVFWCSQFEKHHAARNFMSLAALLASAMRDEIYWGLQPPGISRAQDVHRGSINSDVFRSMFASYRHFWMEAKRLLGQLRFRWSCCGHSICLHGTKYAEGGCLSLDCIHSVATSYFTQAPVQYVVSSIFILFYNAVSAT